MFVDDVLAGDDQAQAQEGAGRQDGQQEAAVVVDDSEFPVGRHGAEQQLHVGEQGALAHQFTHAAENQQDYQETQAHHKPVHYGGQDGILAGKGISAAEHGAVGHDQRNEDAEDFVQLEGVGLHQHFDHRHHGGDNHHEGGQTHRIGDVIADQRDTGVGAHQHYQGCQAQPHGVDHGTGDRQQRAQAENLYGGRVVIPQTVHADFLVVGITHHRSPPGWCPQGH